MNVQRAKHFRLKYVLHVEHFYRISIVDVGRHCNEIYRLRNIRKSYPILFIAHGNISNHRLSCSHRHPLHGWRDIGVVVEGRWEYLRPIVGRQRIWLRLRAEDAILDIHHHAPLVRLVVTGAVVTCLLLLWF